MDNQPTITVVVYSYNSSEYIVDTLESIRNQTYPNLMLVVSDDCSSDNTVEICKKWIEKNNSRFKGYKIVESEINTGISANANRAWDACETEFIKDIAGDDVLLPNCIQDYVAFIQDHPEAVVVFARVRPFYVGIMGKKWRTESWHDYSFFSLNQNDQRQYLFVEGNNLPAASCFYNLYRLRAMNFRHDERVPLLEDYSKWLFLSNRNVVFYFMDKHTVGYRLSNKSLSIGLYKPVFYKSNLLLYLYYFQNSIENEVDRDKTYNLMCDHALRFYVRAYDRATKLEQSWDYRIGHFLLCPIRFFMHCISSLKGFRRNNG